MEYIKSLRLPICFLAAVLAVAGYSVAGMDLKSAIFPAITVLLIFCSGMAQNDYADREHDVMKGKTFASKNPEKFENFVLHFWAISGLLVSIMILTQGFSGLLAFIMLMAGRGYSSLQKIPFIPQYLVAGVSASPLLFPVMRGGYTGSYIWLLFVATALIIYGRETVKDIEDADIDEDKKWTIASNHSIGAAFEVAVVMYTVAAVFLSIFVDRYFLSKPMSIIVPLAAVAPAVLTLIIKDDDPMKSAPAAKIASDLGTVVVLGAILFGKEVMIFGL